MVRVLAVVAKSDQEVLEYVVLEDRLYPNFDSFLEAARRETRELSARHGLPNDRLELFDGCDRSVESLFRMFPNLKWTARSVRAGRGSPDGDPRGGRS